MSLVSIYIVDEVLHLSIDDLLLTNSLPGLGVLIALFQLHFAPVLALHGLDLHPLAAE